MQVDRKKKRKTRFPRIVNMGPWHSAHVLQENGTSRPFNGYWHRQTDSNCPVNCRTVSSLTSQCEKVVETKSPRRVCVSEYERLAPFILHTPSSLSFHFCWYVRIHTRAHAFFIASRSRWRRHCRDGAAARLNRSFSLNRRIEIDQIIPSFRYTPQSSFIYPPWNHTALNACFNGKCPASSLCVSSISLCRGEWGRSWS